MLRPIIALAALALGTPALATGPVVVELYQSQGCSSCPPAIANVNALGDRADVLPLMFAVTYWDQLGWKDVFAKPEFTRRQRDYSDGLKTRNIWTPQVIINGRAHLIGNQARPLAAGIAEAQAAAATGPVVRIEGNSIEIGTGSPAGAADVWVVHYDPRTIEVAIKAGENNGRTLPHRNIVKAMTRIGSWNGAAGRLPLPATPPGLKTAVLVQQGRGGPIVSAARG